MNTFSLIENDIILSDGTIIYNIHNIEQCKGRNCTIHNPSKHHMTEWPLHWRSDRKIFERICIHGVGHPDPDSLYYEELLNPEYCDTHGCCGCCIQSTNAATIQE